MDWFHYGQCKETEIGVTKEAAVVSDRLSVTLKGLLTLWKVT